MSFAAWCIVIGGGGWAIALLLGPLFVNQADARNPVKILIDVARYGGMAAVAWGLLIVLLRAVA